MVAGSLSGHPFACWWWLADSGSCCYLLLSVVTLMPYFYEGPREPASTCGRLCRGAALAGTELGFQCELPCSVQRLRSPPTPYLSTCWMVQRLTSRSLANLRWLTPFDFSVLMYSRCCSLRFGRRPGKRPLIRAFALLGTERSLSD